MPSKRRKSEFQGPRRRVYSTREIMEITEQRRVKRQLVEKDIEPKNDPRIEPPQEVPAQADQDQAPPPLSPVSESPDNLVQVPIPQVTARPGSLVILIGLSALFLILSFIFPQNWMDTLAAKLNGMVIHGSYLVLNIIQGNCRVQGGSLVTHYYKVSLQGDLTSFYSVGLLFIFAVLFSSIQKGSWIKKVKVFISLVPLALVANMIRVLWACGLALNYGIVSADQYFRGVLVDFVFVFIILGLIFLEFLFISDDVIEGP